MLPERVNSSKKHLIIVCRSHHLTEEEQKRLVVALAEGVAQLFIDHIWKLSGSPNLKCLSVVVVLTTTTERHFKFVSGSWHELMKQPRGIEGSWPRGMLFSGTCQEPHRTSAPQSMAVVGGTSFCL